jgi:anti-sigma regulatory factor (Ser/Thr protein kinase)
MNEEARPVLIAPASTPGEVRYEFRTMAEAKDLATALAAAHPDPDRVLIGLTELLVNAVEHGNLGITYREKTELLESGDLQREIERRLELPELASRRVRVIFRRDLERLSTTIEDEGEGFDWRPYLDVDPERALDPNGHGIAIACGMSFDEVTYQGKGNVVIAVIRLGEVLVVEPD